MILHLFCVRKVYVFIFLYIFVILVLSDVKGSIEYYIPKDFIVNSRLRRESNCGKNLFECRDQSCISVFSICDGTKNCPDGSDEVLSICMKNLCPKNTFRCAYGGCIDGDKKCDGRQDCADNSDELLEECPGFTWLNSGVTNKCKKNEFQCRIGDCINKDELCDGKKDCLDGSDETVTHCNAPHFTCPRESFRCAYGACVDSFAKCNGVIDCADASDEDMYICNRTCNTTPPPTPRPTSTAGNQPSSLSHDCTLPEITPGTRYEHLGKNIIRIVCDSNYNLSIEGSPFIACYNGQWSPKQMCLPQCLPLKSITATYTCYYNDKKVNCNLPVKPGTESQAECAPGYYNGEHFPRLKNICLETGKWQYPQYTCNEDCGNIYDSEAVKPQVAYGTTTTIGKFPWNAGIYRTRSGVFHHICGGTLISSYIVLTAAHCVTDDFGNLTPTTDMRIAVGKYNRAWEIETNATQKRDISGLFIPNNFQGVFSNFKYDIALIELTFAVILSTVVMPICIPLPNQNIYNRQNGYIPGWGQDENNAASEVLKSATLPYIDRNECINLVPKSKEKVTEDKFCAFIRNGTNVVNVMQGDSGAGFVFEKNGKHYIHGIVSTKVDNIIPTFTDITNEQNKNFLLTTHQDIERKHNTAITL